MSHEIIFEKTMIVGNVQVTGKQLTNKLRVVAVLTEKTAEALGVRYSLYSRDGVIRFGPKAIELEVEFDNAWFHHEIPSIGKLTLVGATIGKFKAFRVGDGKKKPKKLMLAFVVMYVGAPLELEEYLMKIGRGVGVSRVQPAEETQTQMFVVEDKPEEKTGPADPVLYDYKNKAGNWIARIIVAEFPEGFGVTWRAAGPTKKLKQGPPATFASESEAREFGAVAVKEWAEKIAAGGIKPEKREAAKLVEWAAAMIPAQTLIDGADVSNPVQAAREYPD